jgi:RNA polymerase sigma factor (sigma-70 family)
MEIDFSNIYEENYDKLFSVAYRLTGRIEDAEDVLQETFFNAYKAYSKFQNRSSLSTWLYKIAVNCSYRYIKKMKKLPVYDISSKLHISPNEFFEMIKSYESVEDIVLENNMRQECLHLFLKCIPKRQRIAFVLKVLIGLSTEEVASIMDTTIGAVKTNVYRARLSMKENMEDKCSYLNPTNPCQCKNWVAYAIKNNIMDLMPKVKPKQNINYQEIYDLEIDFLSKVAMLYNDYPEKHSYTEFINNVKEMISNKSLKLLS